MELGDSNLSGIITVSPLDYNHVLKENFKILLLTKLENLESQFYLLYNYILTILCLKGNYHALSKLFKMIGICLKSFQSPKLMETRVLLSGKQYSHKVT